MIIAQPLLIQLDKGLKSAWRYLPVLWLWLVGWAYWYM